MPLPRLRSKIAGSDTIAAPGRTKELHRRPLLTP
jgi:hypothetical protein